MSTDYITVAVLDYETSTVDIFKLNASEATENINEFVCEQIIQRSHNFDDCEYMYNTEGKISVKVEL